MRYERVVATATNVHPAHAGRSQARPRNGDLDFFEELAMTALIYRGHTYGASQPALPTKCVELTYRHEHYNLIRTPPAPRECKTILLHRQEHLWVGGAGGGVRYLHV